MFEQLGLIGCGLMGGSFALALKEAGLVGRVAGYSKSPRTLHRARELGVIDVEAPSALLAVSGADIVLLAVPVAAMEDSFKAMRHLVGPQTLIMDVGSTKGDVVAAARRVLKDQLSGFVPAHPMTGKEHAGVDHAEPGLYRDRQTILTPLPETDPRQVERASQVWRAIGSQVKVMSPEAHDAACAAISHLPHLLTFAAMNAIVDQEQGQQFLELAGPGFRDFSRIAASDPIVWRDILLANRSEVLSQSRRFRDALDAIEAAMASGNGQALQALILQGSEARADWHMRGKASPAKTSTAPSSIVSTTAPQSGA